MKKYRLALSAALLLFSLSACGPVYKTDYSYVLPKSTQGKMCVNQCQQTKMFCEQSQSQQQLQCDALNLEKSKAEFKAYKASQESQNLPVTKSLNDFSYNSACQPANNHCEEYYKSCYTNCGGQVIAHTRCVAFCDKVDPKLLS